LQRNGKRCENGSTASAPLRSKKSLQQRRRETTMRTNKAKWMVQSDNTLKRISTAKGYQRERSKVTSRTKNFKRPSVYWTCLDVSSINAIKISQIVYGAIREHHLSFRVFQNEFHDTCDIDSCSKHNSGLENEF
jgi:hypothetical protein